MWVLCVRHIHDCRGVGASKLLKHYAGFDILYGVGMDGYTKFFSNYLVMNRTDIDGYRLTHNAKKLYELFGISVDADF